MLTSIGSIFPPCFQRTMVTKCPAISPSVLCQQGANANTTIIEAVVNLSFPPPALPDVYNETSSLILQGVLAGALKPLGALNVEITNYAYYDTDGVEIAAFTPITGQLVTDDYDENTGSGVFYYNIYAEFLDIETAQQYEAIMLSTDYQDSIGAAYGQPGKAFVTVNTSAFQFIEAKPFDTAHSGAAALPSSGFASLFTVLTFFLLVQWL